MKYFKPLFLSTLGFLFFLFPFDIMGENRIAIAHILSFITKNYLDEFLVFTEVISWIVLTMTLIFIFFTSRITTLNKVFKASPLNVILRLTGSFLYLMVIHEWFGDYKWSKLLIDPNTGGVMAGEGGLLTTLYVTFFVGLMAMPLLTHFGAVEFIGSLFGKSMKKIFKVPGYAAVDAIASFVGDGTIGILVTDQQYKRGYYTQKEAYIIATNFSIVGIAFATAVAEELGISHIFPQFYASIAIITIIIAAITARCPLKKFKNTYYQGVQTHLDQDSMPKSSVKKAIDVAVQAASKASLKTALKASLLNVTNTYVGFLPVIMTVGTLGLVLAEHTPLFEILSFPFQYLYTWMGFASASVSSMAPASIAGLADMYLPALFMVDVASEQARFFIGTLSFTQLVFLSETGMILVKTSIGITLWDVIKIFFYRTLLSIPLLWALTLLFA